MTLSPAKVLTKPVQIRSAIITELLIVYVAVTFIIFFHWVIPSFAVGTTSDVFAVDSTLYTNFANSLREGFRNPWVLASLAHFPNTLWTPVFISYVLPNPFDVMLLNYGAFVASVLLLKRSYRISLTAFLPLLLMNPTSTMSILCVNKEVLDLLAVSIFLYSRARHNRWLLLSALGLALLNRWEVCAVMITFMVFESKLNPLRRHRITMLILLVLGLNFAMPLFAAKMLSGRFEEAQFANTIAMLDRLQMHYLYAFAVVPKIAENLFGQILNKEVWEVRSSWLLINLFNNISSAVLFLIAVRKRLLILQSDLVYFAAIGAVIVAQSLAVQPRYFYFLYVVICLQIALQRPEASGKSSLHAGARQVVDAKRLTAARGEVS